MKSKINDIYRKNNTKRILQGDLITEVRIPVINEGQVTFLNSEYNIILSQDCDLNQDFNAHNDILSPTFKESNKQISALNNKMIPSILICPTYPAEHFRKGEHLDFLDLEMTRIGKAKSTPWKNIIHNDNPRYHYLGKSELIDLPDFVIDFKRYYTISRDYIYDIYEESYCISLNELYREDLSNRFCNFQSRIGLP